MVAPLVDHISLPMPPVSDVIAQMMDIVTAFGPYIGLFAAIGAAMLLVTLLIRAFLGG